MGQYALTKAQINELRLIRDEDNGYLARGDQAGLCAMGLVKHQGGHGFYCLTSSGIEARNAVLEKYGTLR